MQGQVGRAAGISHRHMAISTGTSVTLWGPRVTQRLTVGEERLGQLSEEGFQEAADDVQVLPPLQGQKRLLKGTTPGTRGRLSPSQGGPRPPTPRGTPASTTMAVGTAGWLSPPCTGRGKPCSTAGLWSPQGDTNVSPGCHLHCCRQPLGGPATPGKVTAMETGMKIMLGTAMVMMETGMVTEAETTAPRASQRHGDKDGDRDTSSPHPAG